LAQSNYAVVGGTITDPQGRAFTGATVQLTSVSTRAERHATSNEQGIFQITGLLPGEYEMKVQAPNFATLTQNLRLEVNQQLTLNLALKVASVKDVVEVQDLAPALHPTDASLGEVVEPVAIEDLPLNGRKLVDLVLTVPGAHLGHGAQTGNMNPLYWRPGQRSAVSIGGNRPNANYYLLDGTTNTDPTFNTLNLSPSPDAVQEFKVQTGSYSAEMGGAGGGQINIVTRSGSNQFHGTAYEFLRNGALDAHSFDAMGTNHLVQNNFGVSFGGPIARNRTFFFANYEGFRHAMAHTMVDTVPTAEEINGDFSMGGVNIFNPFSSHPNPSFDPTKPVSPTNPQVIRDQFLGNMIPQNMIDPAAQAFLLNHVPRPNMDMMDDSVAMPCGSAMMGAPTVVGAGTDCNNYIDVRNELHSADQGTIRIDHIFERGDSLAARYSASAERGFTPGEMVSGLGSLLPGVGSFHDNFSQQGSITWNRVLNPRVLNSAAITVSRLAMHRSSENSDSNDIVSELGIQGVGFGGAGAFGAPFFNVQGYSPMGDNYAATPMKAWIRLSKAVTRSVGSAAATA
jgi:hypothetical protein